MTGQSIVAAVGAIIVTLLLMKLFGSSHSQSYIIYLPQEPSHNGDLGCLPLVVAGLMLLFLLWITQS